MKIIHLGFELLREAAAPGRLPRSAPSEAGQHASSAGLTGLSPASSECFGAFLSRLHREAALYRAKVC